MANVRRILAWLYWLALFIAVFKGIWWAFGFAVGLSLVITALSLFYERKPLKHPSFVEKVQRRLGLSFVKVSIAQAKPKRIIAGFVIPIFPAFVKIRYQNEKIKLEAIIHELCHLHYFIYGFQIAGFLLLVQLGIGINPLIKWSIFVLFLLFQEFLAFNHAHKIGKEFGIDTRKFNNKILFKYVLVYSTVAALAYITMYVLRSSVGFLFGVLLFFIAVKIIDMSFWYLFKFIDGVIGK
jgi:hypothetical protein